MKKLLTKTIEPKSFGTYYPRRVHPDGA